MNEEMYRALKARTKMQQAENDGFLSGVGNNLRSLFFNIPKYKQYASDIYNLIDSQSYYNPNNVSKS